MVARWVHCPETRFKSYDCNQLEADNNNKLSAVFLSNNAMGGINMQTSKDVLDLIEKAKEQHLEHSEIIKEIDKMEFSEKEMDSVYSLLEKEDIDIGSDINPELLDFQSNATQDSLQMYLREVAKIPLLSQEKEIELAKKIKSGTPSEKKEAKDLMITSNLRLVISIAKKFHFGKMDMQDLIQEGTIGLMKAIDKYDYTKGYRFSTYATWWVRQAISRSIADKAKVIRIPIHMHETISKVKKVKQKLSQVLDDEPTPEQIAKEMKMPVSKIKDILQYAQDIVSLDTPVSETSDTCIGDFVEDSNADEGFNLVASQELHNRIIDALDTLTVREKKIMCMRYGIGHNKTYTLEDIGKEFGITRERVRQIETKALKKLKHSSRSVLLEDFI